MANMTAENSSNPEDLMQKLDINSDPEAEKMQNGFHDTSCGDNRLDAELGDGLWGFKVDMLYKLAVKFVKEKEGKAVHFSYEDKLRLVAYTQQITRGPFNEKANSPLGYLDVIGRDRRQTWASLGNITAEKCMTEYINLLGSVCPLFKTYIEAHKRDIVEKERQRKEEEERIRKEKEEEEMRIQLEKEVEEVKQQEIKRQEAQRRQIQEALNQQTYHQFKAYAQQQYPGNPEQQAVLVRQLQEQHYQQYMQQVYQQQLLGQNQDPSSISPSPTPKQPSEPISPIKQAMEDPVMAHALDEQDEECQSTDNESNSPEGPNVASASMWTRKDIEDFKEAIKKEGGDSVIKVGHGETVTVRVPTHEDGTCLFWEFATNSYDIGFGLYFEWTKSETSQVSVHVSESEDDEDEIDEDGEHDDIERGASGRLTQQLDDKPPVTVIIPVYRRDCHEEVYAGSHVYPGQGVYLLKFDNSYSLWRSKTLYYRVYYTR